MKQEDKELLLKDLSARLLYGVKVSYIVDDYEHDVVSIHTQLKNAVRINDKRPGSKYDKRSEIVELWTDVKCIKPYLFPLSSMTKEQSKEYHELIGGMFGTSALINFEVLEDFFHKNHLDYRGLIPMGLANDATGLNIY